MVRYNTLSKFLQLRSDAVRLLLAVEYANTTVRGALGGTERPESNASEDSNTNVDEISDEQVEDFLRNQYRSVKRSAG